MTDINRSIKIFLLNRAVFLQTGRIFIRIYYKKTKMELILAYKIKTKKFIKENRNLKTSKLINTIKHVLNIEIGPQTQRRLKKLLSIT